MAKLARFFTSHSLSDPTVLDAWNEHRLTDLDIELKSQSDLPPWSPGPTHQILASAHRRGMRIVARAPYADSTSPGDTLSASVVNRMVMIHADSMIGKGARDLTPDLLAQRESLLVFASAREHLQAYNPFRAPRSDPTTPPMCQSFYEVVRTGLRSSLRCLGIRLPAIQDDPVVPHLAIFVKEAVDNAFQHARHSVVDGAPISGIHAVTVRRVDGDTLDRIAPRGVDEGGPIAEWAIGTRRRQQANLRPDVAFIEVSISDAGEGIPATMRESAKVYEQPHTFELATIDRALQPGGTRGSDRPSITAAAKKGEGFPQMLQALAALRGAVQIWTGRSLMAWSSIDADGERKPLPFERSMFAFHTTQTEVVAGTSLSVILAIDASAPGQTDTLFDV